jgi:3-mercaptopyruvate sulfurtransferase SseA
MSTREQFLATTDWLADHVDDPRVRILECTVFLRPREDGKPGYSVVPGRAEFEAGHIPGSVFADLHNDLRDQTSDLRFMMPPADAGSPLGLFTPGLCKSVYVTPPPISTGYGSQPNTLA